MACPTPDDVLDYLSGRAGEAAEGYREHLDGCSPCRDLFLSLVRSSLGPAGAPREAGPLPSQLGRYRLLDLRGAGAMGVVFRAHDPELDRTVALKLLRHGEGTEAAARLRAEAQSLARVSHPNVVHVYDAGGASGCAFLVMEFVEGGSLRERLRHGRLPWAELRPLFLEAAQGLEAIHAAGLVHRDFKPENVLIGLDGRARVTDFGLAQAGLGQPGPQDADPGASPRTLTGTPAYMAPEQRRATQWAPPRTSMRSGCCSRP